MIINEECGLIKTTRELDLIGRSSVCIAAMDQMNDAMKEKSVRKDKRKKEILEKTIKVLTKAVAEM